MVWQKVCVVFSGFLGSVAAMSHVCFLNGVCTLLPLEARRTHICLAFWPICNRLIFRAFHELLNVDTCCCSRCKSQWPYLPHFYMIPFSIKLASLTAKICPWKWSKWGHSLFFWAWVPSDNNFSVWLWALQMDSISICVHFYFVFYFTRHFLEIQRLFFKREKWQHQIAKGEWHTRITCKTLKIRNRCQKYNFAYAYSTPLCYCHWCLDSYV